MRGPRRAGACAAVGRIAVAATVAGVLAGCELEEVTIVDPEDVVVAEAHVQLGLESTRGSRVTVFLHRTLGPAGESLPVPGARVTVSRAGGFSLELAETEPERCVVTTPVEGTGSCHWAGGASAARFQPGDTLELRVDLPGGGVMRSMSVAPGAFEVAGLPDGATCGLPADTAMEVRWSRAEGAWAYVNEMVVRGLTEALAPRGITVQPDDDPLYLLGLSVSASDTTIVFPSEFGLFNRFELDQDIALALQAGLPPFTVATVTISATDRNYVNWVRGGNFNPSGQVRIPSIRGAGTGVFSTAVIRRFAVFAGPEGPPDRRPACPGF